MTESINPDDFIITRKRKKYRFAKFANATNCYEFSEWQQQSASLPTIDVLEIGAGTGLFSVELAARHPDQNFVAIDVKADRLQKGAYQALERGLKNVYFLRARADQIDELFAPGSVAAIWLTFPDPFPKKRSASRRLAHPNFLDKYQLVISPRGKGQTLRSGASDKFAGLYLKHDNLEFFQWSLEQLVAEHWTIDQLSFDLHQSELVDDYKLLTTYERRWLDEGRKTYFVQASRPDYTDK